MQVNESSNSVVQADNGKVTIKTGADGRSKGDLEFKGANIVAKDVELDIKGDLDTGSLQDTHQTRGKKVGVNAGFAGSGELSAAVGSKLYGSGHNTGINSGTIGASYGQTKEDAAWVGLQTGIVGSESVKVNVGGKLSNTGAVIANADYKIEKNELTYSNDKEKLEINAKSFENKDIKDYDYRSSYEYGGQIS